MSDQPIPEEAIEAIVNRRCGPVTRSRVANQTREQFRVIAARDLEAALPFLVAGWRARLLEDEAIERGLAELCRGPDWTEIGVDDVRAIFRAALGEGS